MEISKTYLSRKLESLHGFYPLNPVKKTKAEQITDIFAKKIGFTQAITTKVENLPEVIAGDYIIGIEIEAEKVSDHLSGAGASSLWNVVNDNSLRNHGKEFVSVPMDANASPLALATLYGMFEKFPVSFSWRTSTHIHLNMRQEKVAHVLNLLILYCLFEDSLLDFVGEQRRTSNFCVPVQETGFANLISHVLEGRIKLPDLTKDWSKYAAINPRPIHFNDHAGGPAVNSGKGTIEFRQLEGTRSPAKIINWINLIACLQRASRNYTVDELESKVISLNSLLQYTNFLNEVFQQHAKLLPIADFAQILYNSVAYAKECFCPFPDTKKLFLLGKKKETGLKEMIKIRTRFQKPEETVKPSKKTIGSLGTFS